MELEHGRVPRKRAYLEVAPGHQPFLLEHSQLAHDALPLKLWANGGVQAAQPDHPSLIHDEREKKVNLTRDQSPIKLSNAMVVLRVGWLELPAQVI